ncbi:hypothetical protein EBT31_00090 [bacterium]|nr:hypothetical protein [bacterium]
MNPEILLLSNLVMTGTGWSTISKNGLTKDHLFSPEVREVFEMVRDFYNTHGQIPSYHVVRNRFPTFPFNQSTDSVDALVEITLKSYRETQTRALSQEMLNDLSAGKDADAVLARIGARAREIGSIRSGGGISLSSAADRISERYDRRTVSQGLIGIPYPWGPLNRATGGMQDEQFIVIYGRPKNGKTFNAIRIACEAYTRGKRVLFYSREMSLDQLMERTACVLTRTSYAAFMLGQLDDAAYVHLMTVLYGIRDGSSAFGTGDIHFHSDLGNTVNPTVDALEAVARDFRPDLLISDGFYLMYDQATRAYGRTDHKAMANISMGHKRLAKTLKIPVIGVTQANRVANNTTGRDVSELGFADAIGQDADLVLRCIKGNGPEGEGTAMLFTAPAMRDGFMRPFSANYVVGSNHELLEENVDPRLFIEDEDDEPAQAKKKSKPTTGVPSPSGATPAPAVVVPQTFSR